MRNCASTSITSRSSRRSGSASKLIERLLKAYPTAIAGIKDSSAKWPNTKAILENFPGFGTFTGWDPHLRDLLRLGGAGTISGMPNINPTGPASAL